MKQTPENRSDSFEQVTWLHRLPLIAGVLALLLIIGYALTFKALPAGENSAAWGTFGDYMGGLLNPLISLFTLMVAMQVWKLQKTELLETRKAVEEQAATAEQQRCEQRFFDLLNVYLTTVGALYVEKTTSHNDKSSKQLTGKTALQITLNSILAYAGDPDLCKKWQSEVEHGDIYPPANETTVSGALDKLSADVDHYFRVVSMVLQQAEPLLKKDHIRYIELFRSQMTTSELNLIALLLLFGHFDNETEARDLASKYALLKHLPNSRLRKIAKSKLAQHTFGGIVKKTECTTSEAAPC